ncbi:hypothetical protein BT63DRAFT_453725 [Microthyrium microscopicum]|uniref:Arabinanase/levansucrase/invertase n=1 Tax=Microthyrium microscopicum TaxID=703497 RepID=A0A6A6UKB3_9PEZI|nr:hypothetical protein BT63DRAFT_453725 [Microthyrium microscopicum]
MLATLRTQALLLVSVLCATSLAEDVQVVLQNKTPFKFDSNGAGPLDVSFGPIFWLNNTYHWIGASSTNPSCTLPNPPKGQCGLRSFQSTDLQTWNDEGIFADLTDPAFSSFHGDTGMVLGRPHMLYNEKTKLYVLWANSAGAFASWTSPNVLGPWKLIGKVPVPAGTMFGGDFTVRALNGSAFLSFSSFNFAAAGTIWPPFDTIQVLQELTPDYTNITTGPYSLITTAAKDQVDRSTEAADLFERDGTFYWTGSATCGNCNDGIMIVYRTRDLRNGPWTRQIISGDTCGGQSAGVLVASNSAGEKTYIHSADLWRGDGSIMLHGKNLQPLEFNADGSVKKLNCDPEASWKFSVRKGDGPQNSGKSVLFTDRSDPLQNYTYTCDLYINNVYQTWQSSKAGLLTEVGINMGALNTTTPFQIGLYTYNSNKDFLTPSVRFNNLYNRTLAWSEVPVGAGLVTIQPNVTVSAGQKLALFITGPANPAGGPVAAGNYCYLNKAAINANFDVEKDTRTLFFNQIGDISPKGEDGTQSPVKVTGRELTNESPTVELLIIARLQDWNVQAIATVKNLKRH